MQVAQQECVLGLLPALGRLHAPADTAASSALAGVSLALSARQNRPLTTQVCFQRVPDDDVLPGDIDVHREIAAAIENPLYLLLDTTDGAGVCDLPVKILESEVGASHPAAILHPCVGARSRRVFADIQRALAAVRFDVLPGAVSPARHDPP